MAQICIANTKIDFKKPYSLFDLINPRAICFRKELSQMTNALHKTSRKITQEV